MKHIKLFESFVNEELTQGTKLSQALILHLGKKPEEKGPEMDKWKEENKVYEKALKDHLKQYDIEVFFYASDYDKSMFLKMYFPESFMSKVKKFFGFGKSHISLTYCVKNLTNLKEEDDYFNKYSADVVEEVSISIGVDRRNVPGSDFTTVDPRRKQKEIIELDREDANVMIKLLNDINPNTKFQSPIDLVQALNTSLSGSFKQDVERGQSDAGYKFVTLNQINLV